MASKGQRLDTNAPGEFYVDSSCIDCDTCRWMAPEVFDRAEGMSRVHTQPGDPGAVLAAQKALIACPTASIHTESRQDLAAALAAFPDAIAEASDWGVGHCGYHSESSFGAASYFLHRAEGNVLIDSPRYTPQLADRIESYGGLSLMFLSHIDDVADHDAWAARFGCERVMHAGDRRAKVKNVERFIEGEDPVRLDDDLLFLPVPGHTKGSACLLFRDQVLFTGDHLAWSASLGHLYAFRRACWYDWETQIASMERTAEYPFRWVLPGHGRRTPEPLDDSGAAMGTCIAWMRAQA